MKKKKFEQKVKQYRKGFCRAEREVAEHYIRLYESRWVLHIIKDGFLMNNHFAKYQGAIEALDVISVHDHKNSHINYPERSRIPYLAVISVGALLASKYFTRNLKRRAI